MYEQKMCYIDLYRNGVKCGNMGHVRMEWDQERYRFGASLCHMDRQTLVTAVLERAGGRPRTTIQNIAIIHGKGSAQFDWMPLEGDEERLLFQASGEVYGICRLPKMREQPKQEQVRAEQAEPAFLADSQENTSQENASQESKKQSVMAEAVQEEKGEEALPEAAQEAEEKEAVMQAAQRNEKQEMTVEALRESEKRGETQKPAAVTYPPNREERRLRERHVTALSDDKWKQLCSIYPTVHPIGDDVEFVKITPVDFVVLRQEYQSLVRNSFLLHGYYNYDHVLLGKYPDKYYIGVPGIMHEQERIAAAMFGFVGFERAEAPEAQKENRDGFGYYMMEVGI